MVCTCRNRQLSRRLLSQIDEFADSFVTNQDNCDTQTENRTITKNQIVASNGHKLLVNGSQVDVQTLERSSTDEVRCEVDNALSTVHTGVHDAILSAMDSLVNPREEFAMKTIKTSSHGTMGLLHLTQKEFTGNAERLHLLQVAELKPRFWENRWDSR